MLSRAQLKAARDARAAARRQRCELSVPGAEDGGASKTVTLACPARVPLSFRTLSDALLTAPATQPFVTMWHDHEQVGTETFGGFANKGRAQAACFQAGREGGGEPHNAS